MYMLPELQVRLQVGSAYGDLIGRWTSVGGGKERSLLGGGRSKADKLDDRLREGAEHACRS